MGDSALSCEAACSGALEPVSVAALDSADCSTDVETVFPEQPGSAHSMPDISITGIIRFMGVLLISNVIIIQTMHITRSKH